MTKHETLDEKVTKFFRALGTRREAHHKELERLAGERGYRGRITAARRALKPLGLVIPRARVVQRKWRGRVIVDSYYRVERKKAA